MKISIFTNHHQAVPRLSSGAYGTLRALSKPLRCIFSTCCATSGHSDLQMYHSETVEKNKNIIFCTKPRWVVLSASKDFCTVLCRVHCPAMGRTGFSSSTDLDEQRATARTLWMPLEVVTTQGSHRAGSTNSLRRNRFQNSDFALDFALISIGFSDAGPVIKIYWWTRLSFGPKSVEDLTLRECSSKSFRWISKFLDVLKPSRLVLSNALLDIQIGSEKVLQRAWFFFCDTKKNRSCTKTDSAL